MSVEFRLLGTFVFLNLILGCMFSWSWAWLMLVIDVVLAIMKKRRGKLDGIGKTE